MDVFEDYAKTSLRRETFRESFCLFNNIFFSTFYIFRVNRYFFQAGTCLFYLS
jgi:hypothetical protein